MIYYTQYVPEEQTGSFIPNAVCAKPAVSKVASAA